MSKLVAAAGRGGHRISVRGGQHFFGNKLFQEFGTNLKKQDQTQEKGTKLKKKRNKT